MSPGRETQKTLCRMCDDRCGIDVYLEDGRIVDIVGNADHVWNRGRALRQGARLPSIWSTIPTAS